MMADVHAFVQDASDEVQDVDAAHAREQVE